MKIKETPISERPRERLIHYGVGNLNNEELLSIVLKTGTKDKSVKELSLEILKEYKDIQNLSNTSLERLKKIKGIGEVKALEVIATIELGRRIFLFKEENTNKKLLTAKDIFTHTRYLFFGKKQEYFYCLYFNNKQQLIKKKLLFIGTVNKSIVHPREVFKEAYIQSASSILCMHNHPSGDLSPSDEDIHFTRNLIEIGKIQGIPIIDHIIVNDHDYYSFYENHNIFTF